MVSFSSLAQQVPIYTNYNFNLLGINPAVAGSQSCLDLRIGYRPQWVGFPGAPKSAYAGVHGSFGKKRYNYHGAGFSVETDEAGPTGYTTLSGSYAYHMKVNTQNMLSFGVSAGFLQYRIDGGVLMAEDNSDVALIFNARQILFPQIGIGLWYQNSERYIGFSVKNVLENQLQDVGLNSRMLRHYYLTAGKTILVDKKLFFKPSVNLRSVKGSPIAGDLTLLFEYDDVLQFGPAFRGGHGISGIVKIDVLKYFTFGYAYDLTLNKLRLGARHTHEVMLGIQACPRGEKKGIPCSAYE